MFFLRYLSPQLVIYLGALMFLSALADELDHINLQQRTHLPHWSALGLILFVVVVLLLLPGFVVFSWEFKQYRASIRFAATNVGAPLKSHGKFGVVFSDTFADLELAALFAVFVFALTKSLNDVTHYIAPEWTAVYVFFLFFLGALLVLTVVGMIRTYARWRVGANVDCCVGAFGCAFCCGNAGEQLSAAEQKQKELVQERNLQTKTAIQQAYDTRKPYQDNKCVYLLSPYALFHAVVDGVHVAILFAWFLLIVIAATFLRYRLAHTDWTTRPPGNDGTSLDILLAAETMPPRFVAAGGALWLSDQHAEHLKAAFKTWQGRVPPLLYVTIWLMIGLGLMLLHALVAACVYVKARFSPRYFIEGVAYVQSVILGFLFLILLTIRIDVHVGDSLSWHNTFAPLYTLILIDLLCAIIYWVLTPSREKNWRSGESRWGLCVSE